jgi:hypothetical protein
VGRKNARSFPLATLGVRMTKFVSRNEGLL